MSDTSNPPETLVGRFQQKAEQRAGEPLWHDYRDGTWRATTWTQARVQTEEIAAGLMALGIEHGDRIGLVGANSSDWVMTDYGIQHAGAMSVPLYNTLAPDQIGYVLGHAGARIHFVDDQEQLDKALASDIPMVEKIVAYHLGNADRGRVIGIEALRELGRQWAAGNVGALRKRMESVQGDDLFSLIYTSGTTGPPKGTMLTHHHALWTADAAFHRIGLGDQPEVLVSYLPLSHVFERLVTTVTPLAHRMERVQFFFVPEFTMLPDALKEARPTVFIGVPRVYEKFEARVKAEVAEAPKVRQNLFNWSVESGSEAVRLRDEGGRASPITKLGALVARKLVGKKVLGEVGLDRCHYAVSGAAPMAPSVQRFFQGLGLDLHQGWGMTETTAACTVQAPDQLHVGSVGTPLAGVELRLGNDGEIQVKGPNIFVGYYNEAEQTKEALDDDGWLYTGDIGEIMDDGSLRIVDRKKDIIITAGGKNIAPQEIEARLKADGLIGEAIVIGDRRPYLVSLVSLDVDEAKAFLGHHADAVPEDEAEIYRHPMVLQHIEGVVNGVNEVFSRAEGIRKWRVVEGGFPDDALTPTLKLKRRVIDEKYAADIDALYA